MVLKVILPLLLGLILLLGGYLVFSAFQTNFSSKSETGQSNIAQTVNPAASPSKPPSPKNLEKVKNGAKKAFAGYQDEEIVASFNKAAAETDINKKYSDLVETFNLMKQVYSDFKPISQIELDKRQNMADSLKELKDYAKKYFPGFKEADFVIPN